MSPARSGLRSLTRLDLEDIRRIVRDELACAVPTRVADEYAPAPDDEDTAHLAPNLRAAAAVGRADARMMRGEPGAVEEHRRADAHFRANYDETYQHRARLALGRGPGEHVTDEEMAELIERWTKDRRARREVRQRERKAAGVEAPQARGRPGAKPPRSRR